MQQPGRIQVSDLLAHPGHGRDESVVIPLRFTVGDTGVDHESTLTVHLRSLTDGIVGRGSVETVFELVCTRCLTQWSQPTTVPFETVFRKVPEDEDGEYPVLAQGWIDLEPVVHDEVSLAVPYRPLCRDDCLGLCQTCGTDLNTAPCGGHGDESGSPFAALKQLFEN